MTPPQRRTTGQSEAPSGNEQTCRWCGDPNVVFTNRLGAHCVDCYAEGADAQRLHEAGL